MDTSDKAREHMVADQLELRGIRDSKVLFAARRVPRHVFVPPESLSHAYADSALPLAEGQTISQPYIVGLMTEMLDPTPECRVLEIGTGSGYQAAILAEIVREVFTVEVLKNLSESARHCLDRLGYSNIRFRVGDGWAGWPEFAPFDRIIVTACAPRIPPHLFEQLSEGGVMVLPIRQQGDEQILCRVTCREGFAMDIEEGVPVRFVPMTSGEGGGEY